MLIVDDTFLVMIDVQEKLAAVMADGDALVEHCTRIARCMRVLGVPVLLTEQTPAKIGPTVAPVAAALEGLAPISKTAFSCCAEPRFTAAVERTKRKRVLLAGIEAHVCVSQTAADLLAQGYHVEVLGDAVASRTQANRTAGLERIRAHGGQITSVEIAVFELMRTSEHPAFRDILKLVK
jgi:nicotinamidase-related amidase